MKEINFLISFPDSCVLNARWLLLCFECTLQSDIITRASAATKEIPLLDLCSHNVAKQFKCFHHEVILMSTRVRIIEIRSCVRFLSRIAANRKLMIGCKQRFYQLLISRTLFKQYWTEIVVLWLKREKKKKKKKLESFSIECYTIA